MTTRECYESLGESYDAILARLKSEALINRLLKMLMKDENFSSLQAALEKQDYAMAFQAAHTIKGITVNLGLNRLAETAAVLTEALRSRQENPNIHPAFLRLEQDYSYMQTIVAQMLSGADHGGACEP